MAIDIGYNPFKELGNIFFGTNKADLQKQIEEKQRQADAAIGEMKTKYMNELQQLKGELARQMQSQGATDANGKLYAAKDVQDQYLDKGYLALRGEQNKQAQDLSLSQNLKLAKQRQLQGGGAMNPAQVAAALESSVRTSNDALANDVREETLRAKGEAGTELGRKQQYATQLTNEDRQNIQERLNLELQTMGLNQMQIQQMQQQFNSMPDGLVQQLLSKGANALTSYLLNPVGAATGVPSGMTSGAGGGN